LGIVAQDLRLHSLIHVCPEDAMQLEVLIEERALAPEEDLVVPDLLEPPLVITIGTSGKRRARSATCGASETQG
jgi:hypothetical protein